MRYRRAYLFRQKLQLENGAGGKIFNFAKLFGQFFNGFGF